MNPSLKWCLSILTFWALAPFLSVCTRPVDKHLTPDRIFFYRVTAHQSDSIIDRVNDRLLHEMPRFKYTMTNRSGQAWPFYEAFGLGDDISSDSLMPPHWYFHVMVPALEKKEIEKGAYVLHIDLMPDRDTLYNFSIKVWEKDSSHMSLVGDTGIHYVAPLETTVGQSLSDYIYCSIIRYSFK